MKRNAPKMILIKESLFGLLETVNYKAPGTSAAIFGK